MQSASTAPHPTDPSGLDTVRADDVIAAAEAIAADTAKRAFRAKLESINFHTSGGRRADQPATVSAVTISTLSVRCFDCTNCGGC